MRAKVFKTAWALFRNNENFKSFSSALKAAWKLVKLGLQKLATCTITFTKKNGTVTTRNVSSNISEHYTRKGTGRKRKEGLLLFVDLAKVGSNRSPIISLYRNQIVSITY